MTIHKDWPIGYFIGERGAQIDAGVIDPPSVPCRCRTLATPWGAVLVHLAYRRITTMPT